MIDVVITSYNCKGLLRACLASLDEIVDETAMHVYVVDNGSRDGTSAMVHTGFPQVDVIENDANQGFARATNAGIARGNSPYVLVLNPDTQLFRGTLPRLLDVMEGHPSVGVCGCSLRRLDGLPDHAAKRAFPTVVSALGHFTGLWRVRRSGQLGAYRAPGIDSGPVDAVNGAFMLMRRRALDDVGGFDERYWMYMEDLDLCKRLKQVGWITWYEPTVEALHHKGATADRRRSPRLILAFHMGMARYVHDHRAVDWRALRSVVYAGIVLRCLSLLMLAGALRACDAARVRPLASRSPITQRS